MPPAPLVLASASPRRRALIAILGRPFDVRPADVAETIEPGEPPARAVQRLAYRKAAQIAPVARGIVIGCDTLVVCEGVILGKPASPQEAAGMLRRLSDRTHDVFSGLALVDPESGRVFCSYERTTVTFRKLDTDEIASYVASGSPMDKAGAYGIQDDFGAVFIRRIDGCYYNVVGLPLARLFLMLRAIEAPASPAR